MEYFFFNCTDVISDLMAYKVSVLSLWVKMSHGFYKEKPLHLGLISVTKVCLVQFLCSFYKIVSRQS